MNGSVGQSEYRTQRRVVDLFRSSLGYTYLGNWMQRPNNSNIEEDILTANLSKRGIDERLIVPAITELKRLAAIGAGQKLYEANLEVYEALRYGVRVPHPETGDIPTIWPIDWDHPERNDFAFAEEVTYRGLATKRPDLVLYVNGIALVTIELKRSTVSISDGIAQSYGNQQAKFIRPFFTTVQLVMAGNDVEGLRYSTIDTPETWWLGWKEASDIANPLDRALTQLCSKERLLEIVHDFILFDKGVKKTCRHNQYFGVKAAQDRLRENQGGIIWHTQGSGKSLTMVWLAKWILEQNPNRRVLMITDRDELDEQIEGVFNGVGQTIYRTSSGADLIGVLNQSTERLICSLIHKFGSAEERTDGAENAFIRELKAHIPPGFMAKGEFVVFVDEAHRTQAGKMHAAMKELLPNAIFIGFTGTPLLKSDRATSRETFGEYIHQYRFDEAVRDGVVLDLRYEARNIEQTLTSPAKVDQWFDAKTKGMTDLSRAELKKRWGTLNRVISSKSRAQMIVSDILMDLSTKPRLAVGSGNALLVCQSIHQACIFYELFSQQGLEGKCAIVSSFRPNIGDISKQDTGLGHTEKLRQYAIYRRMLADFFQEPEDTAMYRTDAFESAVKQLFIHHPGQMQLLIVVDKLLTGFDSPPATYLYIDKPMQDHGLFQAICRVNRLDGVDKEYGYIVDYRDLFNSMETAITNYTSGALNGYEEADVAGLLTDRVAKAREDLEEALEQVRAVCEPVLPPKGTIEYQHYFVATEPGDSVQIKDNEARRVQLYKSVAAVVRTFAAMANDMEVAGFSAEQTEAIRAEIERYADVRTEVKIGAGENVDFRQYEAGMRFLLDNFIQASPSETISHFEDKGLVQLIVELGAGAIDRLPKGIKENKEAVAETIVNNARIVIVEEHALNPRYYDRISELLDSILEDRRKAALAYEEFLQKLLDLATQLGTKTSDTRYPDWADTGARQALYDFSLPSEDIALRIDEVIRLQKLDSWVGNPIKEKSLRNAIREELPPEYDRLGDLMELIKARDEYK